MKRVSVILPVYNVEKWINRCMESIIRQTIGIDALEVICVDDCSSDNSFEILCDWEKRYPESFIIVRSPQNGRQGQARNIGLSYASADWIGFIDSDDWIEPDYFERMLEAAEGKDYEMVSCLGKRDFSRDLTYFEEKERSESREYRINNDDERRLFIVRPPLGYCAWGKLIRKEFIISNDLFFPANITYEDAAWASLIHLYVNSACIIEENLYHYFVNDESTVLKRDSNHHLDCLTAQTYVWREYKRRGFLDVFYDELQTEHIFSGYLPALKICILRYGEPDYNIYLLLRELMLERLDGYKDNPYVKKGYVSEYYMMLLSAVDNMLSKEQFQELANNVRKIGI